LLPPAPKEGYVDLAMEGPVFRNRNIVIVAAGAAVVIALLSFNFLRGGKQEPESALLPADSATAQPAAAGPSSSTASAASTLPEMSLGKSDAPVTIVEYSSLSCPHCAAFHKDVLPTLKSEYIDTGKIRYEVREFPLNDAALAGSVVARCLDPSRYFAFTDLLFSKQDEWAFKNDALSALKRLAKQAGLSDEKFDKCIQDPALQKEILEIRTQGEKKGVNGTPSFFVNGKPLKGTPTLEAITEAVKPYLSTQ
jgi:protein-disulfide isomerase